MVPSFLISVALLTGLFMTNKVFLLLDLVLNKKVPLGETLLLYISLLPFLLSLTIPMSMTVGTLLAFGRLSSDMEITAFKGNGVHLFRLMAPVLVLGLLMTGLMVGFNDKLLPRANLLFKETQFNILRKQADVALREKVFIDRFEGYQFYIDHQDPRGGFADVKVFNRWSPNATVQATFAKTGSLVTDQKSYQLFFHLNDGVMSWDNDDYQTYNQLYFQRYVIRLKLENQLAHMTDVKKGYEEMDLGELSQARRSETDPGQITHLDVEYQKRLALPFACLMLSWFCAPLGLWAKSKGFLGFVLGLAMIFVYYLMFILGQTLANQGSLNPILGLWAADIAAGLAGCLLYYLVMAEHSAFRGFRMRKAH